MNGTGVTIILTSSTSGNYATVTIDNGATVTLSAPTSGTTAGIVFFGDRRASATNSNNFGGGAAVNITGAVYFPVAIGRVPETAQAIRRAALNSLPERSS